MLLLLACTAQTDSVPAVPSDTDDTYDTPSGCKGVVVGEYCVDGFEAVAIGELGNRDQGADWPDGSTEAVSEAVFGDTPTHAISWYQAASVCMNQARHLCTVDEWQAACGTALYPWGDAPEPVEVCVVAAPDGSTTWTDSQTSGFAPDCKSAEGVYDQMGNLWEWADPGLIDDDGTPMTAKLGGAWYAGGGDARCGGEPFMGHPPEFDGDIGFRCCG